MLAAFLHEVALPYDIPQPKGVTDETVLQTSACFASHITLRCESGKDFTLDGVDLMKKRLENGDDFFAVNPKGQVPALLLDDGTLLTEGVAIMQYLADSVPDRQLLAPTSSLSRYKTIEWLNWLLQQNCMLALRHCSVPIRRKTSSQPFARCWRKMVCERLAKR